MNSDAQFKKLEGGGTLSSILSNLQVGPACDYPADVAASGGKLAIVNLQPTPLDARADVVIRGACDQVMELLLSKLHLDIGLSCGIHELTREPCKSQKTGKPSWGPTDCRELTLFLVPHASA